MPKAINDSLNLTLLVLLMISASGQDTLTFKVRGLVCSFCAHGLNKGIGKLPFTDEKSVWVDVKNQIVKVAVSKDFKSDPHLKQTIELIKETGYEVDKIFLNETETKN